VQPYHQGLRNKAGRCHRSITLRCLRTFKATFAVCPGKHVFPGKQVNATPWCSPGRNALQKHNSFGQHAHSFFLFYPALFCSLTCIADCLDSWQITNATESNISLFSFTPTRNGGNPAIKNNVTKQAAVIGAYSMLSADVSTSEMLTGCELLFFFLYPALFVWEWSCYAQFILYMASLSRYNRALLYSMK